MKREEESRAPPREKPTCVPGTLEPASWNAQACSACWTQHGFTSCILQVCKSKLRCFCVPLSTSGGPNLCPWSQGNFVLNAQTCSVCMSDATLWVNAALTLRHNASRCLLASTGPADLQRFWSPWTLGALVLPQRGERTLGPSSATGGQRKRGAEVGAAPITRMISQ